MAQTQQGCITCKWFTVGRLDLPWNLVSGTCHYSPETLMTGDVLYVKDNPWCRLHEPREAQEMHQAPPSQQLEFAF